MPKYPIFNPFKRYLTLNIPEGVARFRGISPGAKLVYGRLYRYAGAKGVAFPNVATLAEEVGLGVRQTQTYIAELREQDFIHVRRQYHTSAVFEFESHPALAGTEVGQPRWGNSDGVKPQDTAESLSGVKPQDTALNEPQDTAVSLSTLPYLYEEGQKQEGHTPSQDGLEKHIAQKQNPECPAPRPTLDQHVPGASIDFRTGEIIPPPEKRKQKFNRRTEKKVSPYSMSERLHTMGDNARSNAGVGVSRLLSPSTNDSKELVELWNKLVPSKPAVWSDRQDGQLLRSAMDDPGFSGNMDSIFSKAELINKHSDSAWLTLQTLLSKSKSNGQPHWHRVLTGQYDSMMKPRAANGKEVKKPVDGVAIAAQMRKERLEREAKEREAATNQDAH